MSSRNFWEEYEYPERPPELWPTVQAIRKAEHVIRKANGELVTDVLGEFNRYAKRGISPPTEPLLPFRLSSSCGQLKQDVALAH